jgi:hypothetical protein
MKILKNKGPFFDNEFISKLLIFSIFLYPLLFIWQCGDLTDSGYFAMNYQNFFENLESAKTNSVSFLSDFIGAAWLKVFPNLGIIGLKFLYLIFFYAIIFITFLLLKNLNASKKYILFGLLCGVICSERFTMFVFHRDICSWLFLVITGYYLIEGLKNKLNSFIYLSGFFFAMACLAKLPNIVFILILPLILIYKIYYLENSPNKLKAIIIKYGFFIVGFTTFLILIFLILNYLSLTQTYISNLDIVKNAFDSKKHNWYSLNYLLARYRNDIIVFFPHVISISLISILATWLFTLSQEKKKYITLIFFTLLISSFSFFIYKGYSCSNNIRYLIPGFCFLPLMLSLKNKNKYSLILFVFSSLALTQVFGSNTGLFMKLNYGFILILPTIILFFLDNNTISFKNKEYATPYIFNFGITLLLFFSIVARIGWIFQFQSSFTARLKMTHTIDHPFMKGILTTKENANHIKNICYSINENFQKENSLLIYGHQPMFYYLTKHQPEVEKCWFDKFDSAEDFINSIEKSIRTTRKWPLIIDVKENVMGEKGEVKLAYFLKKNGYNLIKNRNDFAVWKK